MNNINLKKIQNKSDELGVLKSNYITDIDLM